MRFPKLTSGLAASFVFGIAAVSAVADEKPPKTVAEIADAAKASLVVVSHEGRGSGGTGSGFVVSEDGLIATNLHVIGEARAVTVKFADGEEFEATEIHASDRKLDLAVIRIDPGKRKLVPLELGDSDSLAQGQRVVAMGNPQGLDFSVVEGVVSAVRDFGGGPMIQLAIPVERGNSGGPVLDFEGKVHGLMTLKSAVTDNLGFAMPSNDLKTLLEKPNPVSIEGWMTIGKLDPDEWATPMGGRWTQRAGMVQVREEGEGFGGRALCISSKEPPESPYEVAVDVKLDDEAGAAGLTFESDGGDLHYGFYPTGGKIRMTRFDGPTVFTWNIFDTVDVPAYREGAWNRLRVRVEGDTITAWVNGVEVMKIEDGRLRDGKVGLCKFRETEASFKNFRVGKDLTIAPVPKAFARALDAPLAEFLGAPGLGKTAAPDELVDLLVSDAESGRRVLAEWVARLEKEASRLRTLSEEVHMAAVRDELAAALKVEEEEIDLIRCGLIVAKLDNAEIDIEVYMEEFDRMVKAAAKPLKKEADDVEKLARLRTYLFEEAGFHGSRGDYYNRSNSYLNEVIDDREGIPITLSVIYLELAKRLGVEGVVGVPLPGHFVVGRPNEEDGAETEMELTDVFEGAKPMSMEEADAVVRMHAGVPLQKEMLEPSTRREIVVRILRNLVGISLEEEPQSSLPYLELLLVADPEDTSARLNRGLLLIRNGKVARGREDIEWLISTDPPGVDTGRLQGLLDSLR